MSPPKPVLADHKRVKSKLVTPFNEILGPVREVSWINTIVPELLWIAVIQDVFGPHRCVEILTAFTRDLRSSSPERTDTVWAAAGKFTAVPADELCSLVEDGGATYGVDLRAALRPFVALYPTHPLNKIFPLGEAPSHPDDIGRLTEIVAGMYDRASWGATMTQAHAVWLAFDAKRFVVSSEMSLAQFPKIDQYPDTEISRQIAGAVRATLNQFFGADGLMASDTTWPVEFWNRGLALTPCRVGDGIG